MSSDALKVKRGAAKGNFSRVLTSMRNLLDKDAPIATIEKRFETLREAFQTLSQKHNEYVVSVGVEISEEEDHYMDSIMESFDEIEIETDSLLLGKKKVENDLQRDRELEVANVRELQKQSEKRARLEHEAVETTKLLSVCFEKISAFKEGETNSPGLLALTDMKDRMKELYEKRENIHRELTPLFEVAEIDLRNAESHELVQLWTDFCNMSEECCKLMSAIQPPAEKPVGATRSIIKFDKIKFDTFTGDIRRYPIFRSEFRKHIAPTCSPDEQAIVLKSYLSPEVRKETEGLGECIDDIWERLDELYGNERKLVDLIVAELDNLPYCRESDDKTTLNFISVIEKAHRDLLSMGYEVEINNSTIIGLIERRLSPDARKEWTKMIVKQPKDMMKNRKFDLLLQYLRDVRVGIEYNLAEVRTSQQLETFHIKGQLGQRTSSCWIHAERGSHPIWKCKVFLSKSDSEKMDLVRKNKACICCLETDHSIDECPRNFTCDIDQCGGKHNRLLHNIFKSGNSFHSYDMSTSATILQLQSIRAVSKHTAVSSLNALWDSGSDLSFITFRKAQELGLKGKPLTLEVTKVGAEKEVVIRDQIN